MEIENKKIGLQQLQTYFIKDLKQFGLLGEDSYLIMLHLSHSAVDIEKERFFFVVDDFDFPFFESGNERRMLIQHFKKSVHTGHLNQRTVSVIYFLIRG